LLNPAQPTFHPAGAEEDHHDVADGSAGAPHLYERAALTAILSLPGYGESVGSYEGDTLVVDTIGQNTKTFIDNYRTPHSDKLHVIERLPSGREWHEAAGRHHHRKTRSLAQPLRVMHQWQGAGSDDGIALRRPAKASIPSEQQAEPIPTAANPISDWECEILRDPGCVLAQTVFSPGTCRFRLADAAPATPLLHVPDFSGATNRLARAGDRFKRCRARRRW